MVLTAYKIYAKILNDRLKNIMENIIGEEQTGFRKGRSTIDAVFTLQQLIEKRREYNLSTYIAFVDFDKAFDRVSREKLWEIMFLRGYPPHLIRTIQSLYHKTKIFISVDGKISKFSKD